MNLGLGLGFGKGRKSPVVRPFFNGVPSESGATFTGGPNVTTDADGVLRPSYLDRAALTGGRWATTVAEGALLGPELFTGNLTTGAGITVTGSDATHIVSFSAAGMRYQSDTTSPVLNVAIASMLAVGKTYQFIWSYAGTPSGSALKTDSTTGGKNVPPNTETSVLSSTTSFTLLRAAANVDVTVSSISVREVIPQWLTTKLDGTDLVPTTLVRGQRLYQPANPLDFPAYLSEPARTNKCTCLKANPTDTTNLTQNGDAAAVLSVVDDTAALAAAGLSGICTSGKVYKLDNSSGVTIAWATISGPTGNTNIHTYSVYWRGTGSVENRLVFEASAIVAAPVTYTRDVRTSSALATNAQQRIAADAGSVVYFILPQLEEGAFATSPIWRAADGTEPLTALTRTATLCSIPTAGRIRAQNCGVYGRVIPMGTGQPARIMGTQVDASNLLQLYGTASSVRLNRYVAGSSNEAAITYLTTTNVTFDYQGIWTDQGIALRIKEAGGSWSAWATNNNTANAAIGDTYEVGTRGGAQHFAGNYPFLRPFFLPTRASLAEYQAWAEANMV